MTCKVLLTTSVAWPSVARLAYGFAAAGCAVDALSPDDAPVAVSRYVSSRFSYRPLSPLVSLRTAMAASRPNLVIGCDDRAVTHLLQLYENAREGEDAPLAATIARSLGRPEIYARMISRHGFMTEARAMGIRVPDTIPVANAAELEEGLSALGLPAVLKADGSWGGEGVALVHNRHEARAAYIKLANPPSRLRSVARALRRRDQHYLLSAMAPEPRIISLQQFIQGRPAASAFASWQGEIAGSLYYDVLVAEGTIGPPNVIRRIDDVEMAEASRKVAERFCLSGIHGMDFIRDATGAPYLIEINTRPTQGSTLAFGPGHDLPASLAACVAPVAGMRGAIPNDLVAFFPREWRRDPVSPYLKSAYHDVPWDDPAVLLASLGVATKKRRASVASIASPAIGRFSAPDSSTGQARQSRT
jgi:hypothetical protein